VFGNQFVGVDISGRVVATATTPGPSETFQLVRRDGDKTRVRIRAPNGLFLQVMNIIKTVRIAIDTVACCAY